MPQSASLPLQQNWQTIVDLCPRQSWFDCHFHNRGSNMDFLSIRTDIAFDTQRPAITDIAA
jgi:hypothetical protein